MTSAPPKDRQARALKSRSRALLAPLLTLAGLFFAVTYVRMSEVEESRHERLPEPHRIDARPLSAKDGR